MAKYRVIKSKIQNTERWGFEFRDAGRRKRAIIHPATREPFQSKEEVEEFIKALKAPLKYPDYLIWAQAEWERLSPHERAAVLFVHEKGKCHYCRRRVHLDRSRRSEHDRATVDHVFPLAAGGLESFGNCVLACHECNMAKGSGDFLQFLKRKHSA